MRPFVGGPSLMGNKAETFFSTSPAPVSGDGYQVLPGTSVKAAEQRCVDLGRRRVDLGKPETSPAMPSLGKGKVQRVSLQTRNPPTCACSAAAVSLTSAEGAAVPARR